MRYEPYFTDNTTNNKFDENGNIVEGLAGAAQNTALTSSARDTLNRIFPPEYLKISDDKPPGK